MTRLRQSMSGIISIETAIQGRKRTFNRSVIMEELEDSSCLFRKGEILDFNLLPSFPNYFYAFTSLLLPVHNPKKSSRVFPQSPKSLSNSLKEIGLTTICLIPCILFILLSLLFMIMEVNMVFLQTYKEKKELYNYILLPNYVLPVLMCGQLLNIVLRRRKSLLSVFSHPKPFGSYDETYFLIQGHNERKAFRAAKTFVYGFLIIGIMVVATEFGYLKTSDWTLTALLEDNAFFILEEFSSLAGETNSTIWNLSTNASEEGIQFKTIALGIIGCTLQLLSFLTSCYIGGIFLFASLTMKEIANKLIFFTKLSSRNGRRIMHTYEFMFQSTHKLDCNVGGLFALFHIQTFLFFVLFLRRTIAEGTILDIYSYVCYFPNIAVTVAAYYYAALTPRMMDKFRSWVRKRESQECLGANEDKIQYLLDEMNTDPNGIGKGVFYVNADLIAKISSSIGAFFLVVAPQNKTNT